MFGIFKKKKKPVKYELPSKFALNMPIPQAESRGFYENVTVLTHKGLIKEFISNEIIYGFISSSVPSFDLTLGKDMQKLSSLPVSGIETNVD